MKIFVKDPEQWHRCFAWRPVRVDDHEVRWLETVERRLHIDAYGSSYEYRAIPDEGVLGVCMMQDPPRVRTWINGGAGHQPMISHSAPSNPPSGGSLAKPATAIAGSGGSAPPPRR